MSDVKLAITTHVAGDLLATFRDLGTWGKAAEGLEIIQLLHFPIRGFFPELVTIESVQTHGMTHTLGDLNTKFALDAIDAGLESLGELP